VILISRLTERLNKNVGRTGRIWRISIPLGKITVVQLPNKLNTFFPVKCEGKLEFNYKYIDNMRNTLFKD
jgi:hypothetical protein